MSRFTLIAIITAAFGLASFARTPLATMSSPEPFTIAGHFMSEPGVSFWPVVSGDEISTSTAPGTILFQDGSKVRLAPKSSVRLMGTVLRPKLVLIVGDLDYRLTPGSKLEVTNSGSGKVSTLPVETAVHSTPAALPQISAHR